MKLFRMSVLSCLPLLVFFASLAYSAGPQFPTATSPDSQITPASVMTVKSVRLAGTTDTSIANLMLNLLASKIEYSLNESTAFILAYNPFAEQPSERGIYQPASNLSVSLKFSF